MKKTRCRLFSIMMTAVVSVSMLSPQMNVAASENVATKAQQIQQQYFPKIAQVQKAARKTEPAEWNKKEINVYKFGNIEDAAYYMLTGGTKYYNKNYFKNPYKIKLTAVESGTLTLAVVGDTGQAGSLYDADQKLIKKLPLAYIKAHVNAGETYYVDFPRNCKEGTITAYILKNEVKSLKKDDFNLQKGEGKETYHTFKMSKRGGAGFIILAGVEDGGKTSYKVQKSQKGKWVTIGKTKTINYNNPGATSYGLTKGNYRLVLKASKKQVNTVVYVPDYYKKNVAYKQSKAKKLDAENIYTTGEQAPRWYKFSVTSTKKQKKLNIETDVSEGGFKFTLYQKGKKKPIKTIKTTTGKNGDKTIKLPKKKATYYVKISKLTKKTNGYYSIEK